MTTRRRPPRPRAATALVAAVAASLALPGCGLYREDPARPPVGAPVVDVVSPRAAVKAADPAELAVTGEGFTQLGSSTFAPRPAVTYAVVVANTGGETLRHATVRVTLQDHSGRVVETRHEVLATVYPGTTVAVGDVLPGLRGVTKMHVEIGPGRSERVTGRPAVLEATDVETRKMLMGPLKTTATVTSGFPEGLWHVRPVAVYRDRDGAVLGGTSGHLRFVPGRGRGVTAVDLWDDTVRDLPGLASTEVHILLGDASFEP